VLTRQALLDCYQRLEKPLYNLLYRMLWQPQDCQDLLQEAFLKVWQHAGQVELATLDAYVYSTALNLARNKIRWRMHWLFDNLDPVLEQLFGTDSPENTLMQQQQQQLLRKALAVLPAKEREVLLLTEYSELTLADVAVVLQIPPGTVASRRNRALKQLQQQLLILNKEDLPDAD
jgi:RNA polymerase sigma-70 factor (ECF subfamily)